MESEQDLIFLRSIQQTIIQSPYWRNIIKCNQIISNHKLHLITYSGTSLIIRVYNKNHKFTNHIDVEKGRIYVPFRKWDEKSVFSALEKALEEVDELNNSTGQQACFWNWKCSLVIQKRPLDCLI